MSTGPFRYAGWPHAARQVAQLQRPGVPPRIVGTHFMGEGIALLVIDVSGEGVAFEIRLAVAEHVGELLGVGWHNEDDCTCERELYGYCHVALDGTSAEAESVAHAISLALELRASRSDERTGGCQ